MHEVCKRRRGCAGSSEIARHLRLSHRIREGCYGSSQKRVRRDVRGGGLLSSARAALRLRIDMPRHVASRSRETLACAENGVWSVLGWQCRHPKIMTLSNHDWHIVILEQSHSCCSTPSSCLRSCSIFRHTCALQKDLLNLSFRIMPCTPVHGFSFVNFIYSYIQAFV
jgi:hypothetical protein